MRSRLSQLKSLTLFLFVFISGCAGSIKNPPVSEGVKPVLCCDSDYQHDLQIQYLGVGGFSIRRGKDAILTAPFFSNPSILRVGLWSIQSDPKQIDTFFPAAEDVSAILVGHAHYDHLMDIPHIAQKHTPHAQIYGSETMKNILAAVLPQERLTALNTVAATDKQTGKWQDIEGTRIRIMAIKSEHAPHFCLFGRRLCLKLYQGKVTQPQSRLPRTAWGWKEGQTLAYLIDFMAEDKKSIDFRIHYQDAASNPPRGFPPVFVDPGNKKRVDVTILCVPGFNEVENYPEALIQKMRPRFVVLAHWESFFRPRTGDPKDLKVVPGGTEPNVFLNRLPQATQWRMPQPGAWLRFKAEQSSMNEQMQENVASN